MSRLRLVMEDCVEPISDVVAKLAKVASTTGLTLVTAWHGADIVVYPGCDNQRQIGAWRIARAATTQVAHSPTYTSSDRNVTPEAQPVLGLSDRILLAMAHDSLSFFESPQVCVVGDTVIRIKRMRNHVNRFAVEKVD